MPITRYRIRNEYSLADPELYTSADRDDPEALLEGVAMAGLIGVLRQLGDLAEFAAEIFHDLHEEVMATAARGDGLMMRVQQLEAEFPSVEKAFLSQTSHAHFNYNAGVDWHANLRVDQNLVTRGHMPRFIMDSCEECRGPPRLFLLDKFDVAGSGACLKRYSDPSFFKSQFVSTGKSEVRREKKSRKTKKKGSRLKIGETQEVPASNFNSKLNHVASDEHKNASKKTPTHGVRLKRSNLNGFGFNQKNVRSYMEQILKADSLEHDVAFENSGTPTYSKMRFDDAIESPHEIHEVDVESSATVLFERERTEVTSSIRNKVFVPSEDELGENMMEEGNVRSMPKSTHERQKLQSLFHQVDQMDALVDSQSDTEAIAQSYKSDPPLDQIDALVDGGGNTEANDEMCRSGDQVDQKDILDDGKSKTEASADGYRSDDQVDQKDALIDGESKTEASADGYRSDDNASEMENYMDALTTMESEMETDTESRVKHGRSFFNNIKQGTDSDTNNEQLELLMLHSKSHSVENSGASYDSESSFKKGRSSSSNSDTFSNFADLSPSHVNGITPSDIAMPESLKNPLGLEHAISSTGYDNPYTKSAEDPPSSFDGDTVDQVYLSNKISPDELHHISSGKPSRQGGILGMTSSEVMVPNLSGRRVSEVRTYVSGLAETSSRSCITDSCKHSSDSLNLSEIQSSSVPRPEPTEITPSYVEVCTLKSSPSTGETRKPLVDELPHSPDVSDLPSQTRDAQPAVLAERYPTEEKLTIGVPESSLHSSTISMVPIGTQDGHVHEIGLLSEHEDGSSDERFTERSLSSDASQATAKDEPIHEKVSTGHTEDFPAADILASGMSDLPNSLAVTREEPFHSSMQQDADDCPDSSSSLKSLPAVNFCTDMQPVDLVAERDNSVSPDGDLEYSNLFMHLQEAGDAIEDEVQKGTAEAADAGEDDVQKVTAEAADAAEDEVQKVTAEAADAAEDEVQKVTAEAADAAEDELPKLTTGSLPLESDHFFDTEPPESRIADSAVTPTEWETLLSNNLEALSYSSENETKGVPFPDETYLNPFHMMGNNSDLVLPSMAVLSSSSVNELPAEVHTQTEDLENRSNFVGADSNGCGTDLVSSQEANNVEDFAEHLSSEESLSHHKVGSIGVSDIKDLTGSDVQRIPYISDTDVVVTHTDVNLDPCHPDTSDPAATEVLDSPMPSEEIQVRMQVCNDSEAPMPSRNTNRESESKYPTQSSPFERVEDAMSESSHFLMEPAIPSEEAPDMPTSSGREVTGKSLLKEEEKPKYLKENDQEMEPKVYQPHKSEKNAVSLSNHVLAGPETALKRPIVLEAVGEVGEKSSHEEESHGSSDLPFERPPSSKQRNPEDNFEYSGCFSASQESSQVDLFNQSSEPVVELHSHLVDRNDVIGGLTTSSSSTSAWTESLPGARVPSELMYNFETIGLAMGLSDSSIFGTTPSPIFPSVSPVIPDTAHHGPSEPRENRQEFNFPLPYPTALQVSMEEVPPLPPLPPLQWRVGKLRHGSVTSGEAMLPLGLLSSLSTKEDKKPLTKEDEMPQHSPMTSAREVYKSPEHPLSPDLPTIGDEKPQHGSTTLMGDVVHCLNSTVSAAEDEKPRNVSLSLEGEAIQAQPLNSTVSAAEDEKARNVSLNLEAEATQAHTLNSTVPAAEDKKPRNVCLNLEGKATQAQPLSSTLSAAEDKKPQNVSLNLEGEATQAQPLNSTVSAAEDKKHRNVSLNLEGEATQAQPLSSALSAAEEKPLNLRREIMQPLNLLPTIPAQNEEKHQHASNFLGEKRQASMEHEKPQKGVLTSEEDMSLPPCALSVAQVEDQKPNGNHQSRPRDPLIEAVASHDKSTLRKVSERVQPIMGLKVDERDSLLEQIRTKSFNLKPAVVAKPLIQGPKTNLNVAAILEKANAIRQAFAGSDEDDNDDSWSDS